jgi:hypothetical protein
LPKRRPEERKRLNLRRLVRSKNRILWSTEKLSKNNTREKKRRLSREVILR